MVSLLRRSGLDHTSHQDPHDKKRGTGPSFLAPSESPRTRKPSSITMEGERQFLTELLQSVQARLAALDGLGDGGGGGGGGMGTAAVEAPKSIRAYDAYLRCVCVQRVVALLFKGPSISIIIYAFRPTDREALEPFVAGANALGDQAAELGAIVQEAWAAQRDFLLMATMVRWPQMYAPSASIYDGGLTTHLDHIQTNTAGYRCRSPARRRRW